jgi:hypothetical protein
MSFFYDKDCHPYGRYYGVIDAIIAIEKPPRNAGRKNIHNKEI